MILKNWQKTKTTTGTCLVGFVYGDSRFPDGSFIRTSNIKLLSCMEGYAITESGSRYDLED